MNGTIILATAPIHPSLGIFVWFLKQNCAYKRVGNKFMTRMTLFIVLTIALAVAIVIPLIFRDDNETANQTISIIVEIISSTASLLTLIIAILLFNRFGIENQLLEKSSETVFQFITEMKRLKFLVYGNNYGLTISIYDSSHTRFQKFYEEQLVFSVEYNAGLRSLLKIAESPYMPKSIYEKVDKIRFSIITLVAEKDIKSYATIHVAGETIIGAKYGLFNDKDMSLIEFLNMIEDVKAETIDWVSKHSYHYTGLKL